MPEYWGFFKCCIFPMDSRMKAGQQPLATCQVPKMCGHVLQSHDCKCQWDVIPLVASHAGRCRVMQGLAGRNKQLLLMNPRDSHRKTTHRNCNSDCSGSSQQAAGLRPAMCCFKKPPDGLLRLPVLTNKVPQLCCLVYDANRLLYAQSVAAACRTAGQMQAQLEWVQPVWPGSAELCLQMPVDCFDAACPGLSKRATL